MTMLFAAGSLNAQNSKSGFYKDLFMDSSIPLNAYDDLPAARHLGLEMERICTWENGKAEDATEYEKLLMKNTFVGSDIDDNGPLLYPDGAPRFKAIFINGGKATTHGKFVTKEGIENLRTFYNNGGSYVGTCAGAFFSSKGTYNRVDKTFEDNEYYLGIFPWYTVGTKLSKSATSLFVEKKCPLLKYGNFGGDMKIDSVRHNGGAFLLTDGMPAGTELLFRYDGDTLNQLKLPIHKEVNGWAYKASSRSGRLVVTGSHPERMVSGDRLEMFAGMIRYAIEGCGDPQLKGILKSGEKREMMCKTADNKPEYTRIGDRQYHHFTIDVPKKTKQVKIELAPGKGFAIYDLSLYAAEGNFAFADNAKWFDVNNGVEKTLVIDNPKAGKLFISVFCETTVETKDTKNGELYTGKVGVLNGVGYSITATIVND